MKLKDAYKIGDEKVKIKFAFFPTEVDGEVIWLERYREVQSYRRIDGTDYWLVVSRERLNKKV